LISFTDPTYLAGHAAAVYFRDVTALLKSSQGSELTEEESSKVRKTEAVRIGTFGILHPTVLKNFELPFPTSTLELDLEVFL
jgi:phenylalanyl-tRNA synthetase beta chain